MRNYSFRKDSVRGKRSRIEPLYRPRKRWYSDFEEEYEDSDDIDYSEMRPDDFFHDRDTLPVDEDFVETLELYINEYRKVLSEVRKVVGEWEIDVENLYVEDDVMYDKSTKLINEIRLVLNSINGIVNDIWKIYKEAKEYEELHYAEISSLSSYLMDIINEFSKLLSLCKKFSKTTHLKLDENVLEDIMNEVDPEVIYLFVKVPGSSDWYLKVHAGVLEFVSASRYESRHQKYSDSQDEEEDYDDYDDGTPYKVFRTEDIFVLDRDLFNKFKNDFIVIERAANRLSKIGDEINRAYLRAGLPGLPLDPNLNSLLDAIVNVADDDVYIIKDMIVNMERKIKVTFGTLKLLSQHLDNLYSNLVKIAQLCDKMVNKYGLIDKLIMDISIEVDKLLISDFVCLIVPVPNNRELKLNVGPGAIEFV